MTLTSVSRKGAVSVKAARWKWQIRQYSSTTESLPEAAHSTRESGSLVWTSSRFAYVDVDDGERHHRGNQDLIARFPSHGLSKSVAKVVKNVGRTTRRRPISGNLHSSGGSAAIRCRRVCGDRPRAAAGQTADVEREACAALPVDVGGFVDRRGDAQRRGAQVFHAAGMAAAEVAHHGEA